MPAAIMKLAFKFLNSLGLLFLVSVPTPLYADESGFPSFRGWLYDYWINGASLTPGIGTREASATVTRISDGAYGKLIHRNEEAYFLSYSTRPRYLRESRFGYNWMLNLSNFGLNTQLLSDKSTQDMGTRIYGNYAYLVPTFFYNWGDLYQSNFVRTGIGLGLGLTTFNGDVILTTSSIPNDRVTISHLTGDIQFAASFMLEARLRNWGLRIRAAGPSVEENGYRIGIADASANFGYSIFF